MTTDKRIEKALDAARDAKSNAIDAECTLSNMWWSLMDIIDSLERARDALEVDSVTYSGPVTVVVWKDGSVTRTRCQEGDEYSKETGFLMCVAKKALPDWHDVMAERVWCGR